MGLSRRFSADMLRNVTDGEVDRVRQLSTELCKLSFIRRNDDWDDRDVLASSCSLDLFLKIFVSTMSKRKSMQSLPVYPTTTFLCSSHGKSEWSYFDLRKVAPAQQ